MAKIRHNNFLDTIDEVLSGARNENTIHLYAQNGFLDGRTIQIDGKEMNHFATTSYLGLEYDPRLKEAAIEAIRSYGTQFPLSKSYVSHPLYEELESGIRAMYGLPGIVTKNSTLGHMAVIPAAVRDEDGVVLDHQVHWSVQNACQLLKLRGIPVEMVRHNNLQMLEDKIKEFSGKCRKIWFMADGVYSMFGDYAPITELVALCDKYPQLHLYFDDVHGMSWKGKNGTGFVMEALGELRQNMVVVGTLSKSFGASGAVMICGDSKLHSQVKNYGGPLTFSAQLEPSAVAAAIASARIHLSPEIATLQQELSEKIAVFNTLLSKSTLPMIRPNDSPVFFLGTAMPLTAYRMVQRLAQEGYFVNPGLYPAVPVKNTGIRITISRNNQQADIRGLVQAMEHHFPKALADTGNTDKKIFHAFGLKQQARFENIENPEKRLRVTYASSIKKIDKKEWDTLFAGQGLSDWSGLHFLEEAFHASKAVENNWSFHYFIIRDDNNMPVLATFFTCGTWKDDILAPESVSVLIEENRRHNPLYLTSKVLGMGSLFTTGEHCYLNRDHPLSEKAFVLLVEQTELLYHKLEADMLAFRDFNTDDTLGRLLHHYGFIRVDMPEVCIMPNLTWNTIEEYSQLLSKRSRAHLKKEVLPFEQTYKTVVTGELDSRELLYCYNLYLNVKKHNYAVNSFTYPIELFKKMNGDPHWEFILLYLREADKECSSEMPVGVLFCYKNCGWTYVPSLIGMDYKIPPKFNLYRQLLFQAIRQAKRLHFKVVDFGVTATFEKKKLGAEIIPKVAFIQAKDNFSMELINMRQTR